MKNKLSLLLLFLLPACLCAEVLTSPDGRLCARFENKTYMLTAEGDTLVLPSRLGLHLDNRTWEMALGKRDLAQYADWMEQIVVDSVVYGAEVDETWTPLYGERKIVRNHYRTMTVCMSRHDKSNYRINVEVRLFNEGLAFRYFFPEHPAAIFHRVVADETEYVLPKGTMAWANQWAQSPIEHKPVSELEYAVEVPLPLEYASGKWAAIMTADVDDWCHSKLKAEGNRLHTEMLSPVDVVTYAWTPWKIILVGNSPADLLQQNDIVLNLSEENRIADAAHWIEPGKIMRETTLTMENAYRTIDFCAEHHIRYMLFDWKWYEPCTSHDGDATKTIDRLDIPKLCAYANSKGVGIWLYVNQHALMRQARELFPLLREWGVVGVKSGFVQYATHRWATWLHDLVRLAAENHLMMNIHDEFRPSGFSRTYPNLLTQEGIHGNEEWPDANHDVNLMMTRMLCGAADYTICYYDRRLKNTHGHQLAASMSYYSPLVTLFWYDKVAQYNNEPEIAWFEQLPTDWDDTRVLEIVPNSHSVVARRSGDTWYVAVMGGNEAQTVTVDLAALLQRKSLQVTLYEDDPTVDTKTHIRISNKQLRNRKQQLLQLNLQPRGGAVMVVE